MDSEKLDPRSTGQVVELGADYLLASSPRLVPPATLREAVLSRIAREPAKVRTDLNGHVVAINPAFSNLCGFSFPEIVGRKPGSLLQGPDTEAECIDVIRQAIRSKSSCDTEMYNYHKDGSRYRVHIRIEPVRNAAGVVEGFEATENKLS